VVAYIVDATVVIQRLIRETHTNHAIALFKQVKPPDELCIPDFCKVECVNVIWKQVRFHGMQQSQAEQLINDLTGLPLVQYSTDGLYIEALKIGLRHQLAIYDSVYIALAKHLNYPLITVDQPQTRAATAEGVTIKPITDFVP
jgi:predicted nucleic acid-binding protein